MIIKYLHAFSTMIEGLGQSLADTNLKAYARSVKYQLKQFIILSKHSYNIILAMVPGT